MTRGSVWCPNGELIQYATVVDGQRGSEVGGAAVGPGRRVGMRPVTSPEDALRIGCDEGLREGRGVGIVGPQVEIRYAADSFTYARPALSRRTNAANPGWSVPSAACALRKVVEDDRHGTVQNVLLERFHDRQASVDLNVPFLLCSHLRPESEPVDRGLGDP